MADEAAWITVGALAHAFSEDSYAPKATTDLAGNTITLHLAEGGALEYRFESATDLFWAALDGPDAGRDGTTTSGQGGTAAYFAAKLREGLYFVDHLRTDERATSVTLLLDLGRGMATVMTGRLPEEAESRQAFADRIAAGQGTHRGLRRLRLRGYRSALHSGDPAARAHPRHGGQAGRVHLQPD